LSIAPDLTTKTEEKHRGHLNHSWRCPMLSSLFTRFKATFRAV